MGNTYQGVDDYLESDEYFEEMQKEYEKCMLRKYGLEETAPVIESADNLPDGWNWKSYNDGSGCLQGPNKESRFFSYDLATYCSSGWIEYQTFPPDGEYDVFYDDFSRFKIFAEEYVAKNVLKTAENDKEDTVER